MTASIPTLVILAGGASSRMWPLREKSLIRFGAEPLLVSQLRRYQAIGFKDVVLVGNPENQNDLASLAGSVDGLRVQVVVQPQPIGMGDALLRAEPALTDRSAPIYINQVHDVVEDALHRDILAAYQAQPQATFLAGAERADYFPGGYLIVDGGGRISGIIEKPGAANRPSNLVNIVAHLHAEAGALFDAIRAEYASDAPGDDHYERAMDKLMKSREYRVVPYKGQWDALKYPWHVLDVMNQFLGQIKGQTVAPDAFVAKTAVLVGDVVISAGAKVFPGAAVVGPAYVGPGAIIGNNSLVRQSMVLDRCEVGFTTEVARSYVAEHCAMHACRVLDSVFAPYVNFSAGCTTANLRIDHGPVFSTVKGQKLDSGRNKFGAVIGEKAFIGVDVMTMPGVKIGEKAVIGPGTHVHQDVKDRNRIYVKQEQVIVEPEE